MRTGLPAALLRGTPSAIRDDRFTRCPFPAATIHAPVALARSSNTAMEHRNRCTDLRHPELLATSLLKCPRQDCCETPSETKKIGKLSPLSSFIFLTLRALDLSINHRRPWRAPLGIAGRAVRRELGSSSGCSCLAHGCGARKHDLELRELPRLCFDINPPTVL